MVAVLAATLVVGAAVQGLVGLGLGLVAAPVVTLLEPSLMPDLLLWLALLLPLVTLGQLGLIVGVGVLLDTMLVRAVLVPAIFALTS